MLDLRSAGPDGEFDTADDVTEAVRKEIASLGTMRKVADALMQWRGATDSWPESLAKLLEKPGEDLLPPLRSDRELKDGWDRELGYAAGAEGAAPTLTYHGADGEAGTADDLAVTLDADRTPIPAAPGLAPFVMGDLKDAWDRPLRLAMRDGDRWVWSITSDGADGEAGSEDDLDSGNAAEIERFFLNPAVARDFRRPTKRRFEMLYVHMPMLSDEVLAKMWAAFPDQRPRSEQEVFDHWMKYRGPDGFYSAADPRDAESGHGAALMKRLAPDAPITLVPSQETFPKPLEGVTRRPMAAKPMRAKPTPVQPMQAKPTPVQPMQARPMQARPMQARPMPVPPMRARATRAMPMLATTKPPRRSIPSRRPARSSRPRAGVRS